ncbi:MAG: hypothetical protein WCI21_05935 [Alphaproteobacteria bacterium]
MPARLRRRASSTEAASDDGPFVSFTDLVIGILFLFLILVAALILMNQEVVRRLNEQIRQLQAQLDAIHKVEAERPPFRLGIVFNIYQRVRVGDDWTYSRTTRVFRAPDGHCVNTVILRSNLSTAWKPPVEEGDVPTAKQQDILKTIPPCGISASGDHWDTGAEEGTMRRVSPTLYEGTAVLHKGTGDQRIYMQYRVLGVYDDFFRQ